MRQGAVDEADHQTVRQVPSRPQLKRDPLGRDASALVKTVILIVLAATVSALIWSLWRRRRQWNYPDVLNPDVRTIMVAAELHQADPESARRLVAPLIQKAERWMADLRQRAATDPAAAAQLRDALKETIASVEAQLWKVQGRDEPATERLTQELTSLRRDLDWAAERSAV